MEQFTFKKYWASWREYRATRRKFRAPIRQYLATVFDGMAKGLFASLIIGTIISQIGSLLGNIDVVFIGRIALGIEQIGRMAQLMMGPAIGAGVAMKRTVNETGESSLKPFALLAAVSAGALGAGTLRFADGGIGVASVVVGDPHGALLAVLIAVELIRRIEGKTKFDLLIIPALVITISGAIGLLVTPVITAFMGWFGERVVLITELHTFPMSILIAVIIGLTLTLPIISSAALCIAISIGMPPEGVTEIGTLAAGAALAGASAQMVGFAVSSFRENGTGGLIAQGIGTSMIQMPNIIKNPFVWIPPIAASAVAGPVAAVLLGMRTTSVGAGMGTSGLVGPFQTIYAMGMSGFLPMLLVCVVVPAIVALTFSELMRKKGLIKAGDLKL
ncbi:MAG: PTS sugar transporter subunit IIC [Defluviitaleaceae bacterium]|nr:PTS sugar transporter subunit IIC [Defluviitaleaceae bacterium]